MEKLKVKDIELLGDGIQIRRYINKHYGSLETFYSYTDFPLTLKTIRTYLSQQEITSDTFKHALVRTLDRDYKDLVLSKGVQVNRYVCQVFDTIRLYKDEEDMELFEHLLVLCNEYELTVERAMMYRAIALNNYYRNWTYRAIEWFEKSVAGLEIYNTDKYVLFTAELAYMCYRENILNIAEEEYKKIEPYITNSKLSSSTLYKYYYWRGIMLNDTNKHVEAREYFNNAYKYSESEKDKADALLNIAITYRRELKDYEAIEQYNKLFELYNDNNIVGIASVYNNIAFAYYKMGQSKEALTNSTKAVFMINFTKDLLHKLIFTHTFVLIAIDKGDLSSCNKYLELLKETIYTQVNKKRIIDDIDILVGLISDIPMLEGFGLTISELIEHTSNKEYAHHLKCCLGNIYNKIILIKNGRYNLEEDHRRLI